MISGDFLSENRTPVPGMDHVIQCGKESGTMYTVRAAHRLGRPLACWMPEDTSAGDFGGNIVMAAEYGASPIRIVRDLREFLEKI